MLPFGRLVLRAGEGVTPQDAPRQPPHPTSLLGAALFVPLAVTVLPAVIAVPLTVAGSTEDIPWVPNLGVPGVPNLLQTGKFIVDKMRENAGVSSSDQGGNSALFVPSKEDVDTLSVRSRERMADRFTKCV